MAGPVDGYIILADDSSYTGARLRAQTRVVNSITVYEAFVVFDRKAKVFGVYEGALAQQTVSATIQDGISTGFLWIHMPTAVSGRSARIRRAYFTSQHGSTLNVSTSAPRLSFARFTFTGTATGATVTTDNDSLYQHPKLDLRTAVTGLTVTLVGTFHTGAICGETSVTAVGCVAPRLIGLSEFYDQPNEDDYIVIAPGEGVVIYQDVAGIAADTRKLDIAIVWDEIDTA